MKNEGWDDYCFRWQKFFRGRFMMMPPSRIGCKEVK